MMRFNNGIDEWVKTNCINRGATTFSKLYSDFCKKHFFVSKTEFGTRLSQLFSKRYIKGRAVYYGISLKSDKKPSNITLFQKWLYSRCIDDLSASTSLSDLYRDFGSTAINRQAFSRYLGSYYDRLPNYGGPIYFHGLRLRYQAPVADIDI